MAQNRQVKQWRTLTPHHLQATNVSCQTLQQKPYNVNLQRSVQFRDIRSAPLRLWGSPGAASGVKSTPTNPPLENHLSSVETFFFPSGSSSWFCQHRELYLRKSTFMCGRALSGKADLKVPKLIHQWALQPILHTIRLIKFGVTEHLPRGKISKETYSAFSLFTSKTI